MNTTTLMPIIETVEEKSDWRAVFESALRVGQYSSIDDLFNRALDAWLAQLAPELRWKIAIDLYIDDEVSTGRAAEIAGLNYVVFMEKLRTQGIPFMAAGPASETEKAREKALIHAGFNLAKR